jgi:hypothetical protein
MYLPHDSIPDIAVLIVVCAALELSTKLNNKTQKT